MSPAIAMDLQLTAHARSRTQSRAIPSVVVDLLLTVGASESAPGGVDKLFFDKAAVREVRNMLGGKRSTRLIERWFNTCAIIGANGRVITLFRK